MHDFNNDLFQPPTHSHDSKAKRFPLDQLFNLAAAVILLTQTILSINAGTLKYLWVWGAGIAIVVGLPFLVRAFRKLISIPSNRRFVRRESTNLIRFREQFCKFSDENQGKSIFSIVGSILNRNSEAFNNVIGPNYLRTWLPAFDRRMKTRCFNTVDFLLSCQEFTLVVDRFNSDFVMRTHTKLLQEATIADHYRRDLEEFRENFNVFLQNLASWSNSLVTEIQKRQNTFQVHELAPVTNFTWVPSFNQSTPFR